MKLTESEIAAVAQAILSRLSHDGIHWTVIQVIPMAVNDSILVRAAKDSDRSCTVSSYFTRAIPTQQAIAQLASSLQDEVIETVWAAVPACAADHPHPLSARVEGGHAVWACPLGGLPTEPIIEFGLK